MPGLLNKLRMMDAAPAKAAPSPDPSVKATEAPFGCYHTEAVYPVSTFCDRRHATPPVLESIFGCAFPAAFQPEDVLFLDTETTGLSGGVGTIAFEVGIGYFTENSFVVEQFLMHSYPEEGELLRLLNVRMQRFPVLCTFNGRSFDVPLLKSRFLMNRMKDDGFPQTHADVLYPARRLWKLRLKQCNLATLETALLGVEREDDLPGALVPQTYFQYLKDGNFEPLQKIMEHNKQDIVSLAQLFYFLCKQVNLPEEISEEEDLFSLARSLEKRGEREKAMKCYRLCADGKLSGEAYRAMTVSEKRQGQVDAAVKLCQTMLRRGDEPVFAYETLAKLYEHQLKNPEQALHYTRQALLFLAEPTLRKNETVQQQQIALQYRYARLRRKIAKASSVS
ncbi:MAG: ribonuclease H-like domain-containing protein [Eubacteriales bacterium]|nr:ribonuclease H-like domain-containing protein [Eubacteriales bacterium]